MQPDVANALAEAAILLLVGMVVVFLFLSMLIGAITFIAWLNRQFPAPSMGTEASPTTSISNAQQANQTVAPNIVAAISAAIQQHRRSH